MGRSRTPSRRLLSPLDHEDLAWAAGFFDGEGTTCGSHAARYPHLSVSQAGTVEEPPQALVRFQWAVGGLGLISGPVRDPHGRRPKWAFHMSGFECVQAVVAMIWPWLGNVKREQATRALLTFRAVPVPRRRPGVRVGRPLGIPANAAMRLRHGQPIKTKCSRGHDYNDAYVSPVGKRYCRQCRRINHRASYLRKGGIARASEGRDLVRAPAAAAYR